MIGAFAALVVATATITTMLTKVASWRGSVESRIVSMERALQASEERWEARMDRINESVARLVKFMLESGRMQGMSSKDIEKYLDKQ